MEAAEETLTYLHDTGLHRKLLPGDKEDKAAVVDGKVPAPSAAGAETNSDESNYVDLDMKPDGAKTVKVTFTGEGNQLSVIKCDPWVPGPPDERLGPPGETELTQLPDGEQGSEPDARPLQGASEPGDGSEHVRSGSEDLRYTDMYLNSNTESDDGGSAVLSDHCGSDTVEDESHYITTHEIQLTELDHDVDCDLGRGTCWEFEDDNLVYSFVDYASFESDDTQEGTLVVEGRGPGDKAQAAAVSTEQEESDLCASSDESVCNKDQSGDANPGQIHLSIKATSRAVNEPACAPASDTCGYAQNFGEPAGPLCDRAQYFIPAPGRQHLASKLRRKDINEYSSGASSSISELDDADKEVRNLTAKSFRSLACPSVYFDAINLSTSSESSMSEYGLNKWSTFVDWNYRDISRGQERSVIAHKTSSATLEMSKTVQSQRRGESPADMKTPQGKMLANKRATPLQDPSKNIPAKDPVEPVKQRGVTLNFRCNVEAPEGTRRPKCSKNARSSEVSGTVCARSACDLQCHVGESSGDTHKRAIFASSLLKNVISKKMQFEQERKMERGEISDRQRRAVRGLHRQISESGSGLSGQDEQRLEGSRPGSCGPTEEPQAEPQSAPVSQGQSCVGPAEESEAAKKPEHRAAGEAKEGLDTSNMLTKLLFVPSYQLVKKEKGCEQGGKPPEIKIRLRSVKENKGCTLNIASLLTPKITYNSVNTFRAANDAKCHFISAADKMPNFAVRDIRETKCKFQTPIYRVRDVRKLVKSSYRFVALDNSENKTDKVEEKGKTEPVKHSLPSPIVIKCHSVKTGNGKSQSKAEACETSRAPPSVSKQVLHVAEQPEIQPNARRQVPGEAAERRNEPKQAAIEKIKAAVKTMEQLYEFDRNEWKRKARAPQHVNDSHVLPLIARKEQQPETTNASPAQTGSTDTGRPQEPQGAVKVIHVPYSHGTFTAQQGKIFSNKSVLHLGNKAQVSISSVSDSVPQKSVSQTSATTKSSRTAAVAAAAAPLSVKIGPQRHVKVEQGKLKIIPSVTQGCPDSENYLTIPGMGFTNEVKLSKEAGPGDAKKPEQKTSPLIMEYPTASIYHHPAAATTTTLQRQQHVLRLSPTVAPAREAVPQTQRKMLLDPTTGHYYLVDTPVEATTKRLLDPETGQYVEVPMSHSPVAPVTPVPLSLSPVTLTPGAYAPTYMIYPGFIPSPTLQAQATLPQSPIHPEDASGENGRSPRPETNAANAESPYYSATGEAPRLQPVSLGHMTSRGGGASSERKPVISITTQQGPRIIAPPSFDGTTMSFVVEHR